jgi:hypothetical protein
LNHAIKRCKGLGEYILGEISDLAGMGKAVDKFLSLVEATVGTLYRPRAIRKEGQAQIEFEANKVVALARAENEVRLIRAEGDANLAERAIARLRSQEIFKQSNIEAIVDKTIPKIENQEIKEDIDKDWLHYFFDSCSGISNESVQELWSKVLAQKITSSAEFSKKLIDCLRWLDERWAKQFADLAPTIYLFNGFFPEEVEFENRKFKAIRYRFSPRFLEEIGLFKENLNKVIRFRNFSLTIEFKELSDRLLNMRNFYELTYTGSQLARIVCPSIVRREELICKETADLMQRQDLRSGPNYSNTRNNVDSAIFSDDKRANLVIGQIIDFLNENIGSVKIQKTILRKIKVKIKGKVQDTLLHDTETIFTIIKSADSKLQIRKNLKGVYGSSLHKVEAAFIEELQLHLKVNRDFLAR